MQCFWCLHLSVSTTISYLDGPYISYIHHLLRNYRGVRVTMHGTRLVCRTFFRNLRFFPIRTVHDIWPLKNENEKSNLLLWFYTNTFFLSISVIIDSVDLYRIERPTGCYRWTKKNNIFKWNDFIEIIIITIKHSDV